MFKYEFIIVHQCHSDFEYIRSIHEFVMFFFTVHARELLNLRGHGLGLDVSRKSRIRSGGLMKRTHGVLFGKKGITDLFKHKECCCVVWEKRDH